MDFWSEFYIQVREFFLASRWLNYYLKAKTVYQVHSPYLFDFLSFILDNQRDYYIFNRIEQERARLLDDPSPFEKEDFGAGTSVRRKKDNPFSIKEIARNSLSSPRQCAIMFRIAEYIGARRILELGTSFGISTLYLAGNQVREVTALEGDQGCIGVLSAMASRLHFRNIHLVCGPFEKTLPDLEASNPTFDLVFMDGHHREEPTIRYFEKIGKWLDDQSVVILDDIHWSQGMENAWRRLLDHPSVTQSIDFFDFGVLFFRPEFLEKQHHIIIQSKYKPWKK